jgi:hypothetical protein
MQGGVEMRMRYHRIDNALAVLFVFLSGLEEKSGGDRQRFVELNHGPVSSALETVGRELEPLKGDAETGPLWGGVSGRLSELSAFVASLGRVDGGERESFLSDNLSSAKASAEEMGREIDLLRRRKSF